MSTVLVVEDNANNLYLIRYILEKKRYTVISAMTGIEGLNKALNEKVDLIVMDIQLPDIDGLEITRRIRAAGNKIPIVALTSYAMAGDKAKSLEAGCTGYLSKPINPETIVAELEKYLT